MPTSRTSKVLQGTAVSILTSIGAFTVWTKHCKWGDIDPATDLGFQSPFYKKFNPSSNPTTHDVCVRKIPAHKLKPELIEDAQKGGTKLVESFCAGVWGGFGFTPQRLYLANKYKNTTTTAHQLWSKKQLQESSYPEGTEITDHFAVLSKSSSLAKPISSIIPAALTPKEAPQSSTQTLTLRCGASPLDSPTSARSSDGLFTLTASLDTTRGFAEFRMQSIFYAGVPKLPDNTPPPMAPGSWILWAHRRYAELWMEGAVRNCMR